MNVTSTLRIAVAVLILPGLVGAAATPTVADPESNRYAVAKAPPLMKKKCIKQFHQDEREKLHYRANVAWSTYEMTRTSEQVAYDWLRWALADPNEHDAIPVFEQGRAQALALRRPVVAKQRDKLYRDLNKVRSTYLTDECLPSKKAKSVFKEALRYYKRSADDIFKAQERLIAANVAMQTAQAERAGQAIQDADLEFATVEENAIRCNELLETLY